MARAIRLSTVPDSVPDISPADTLPLDNGYSRSRGTLIHGGCQKQGGVICWRMQMASLPLSVRRQERVGLFLTLIAGYVDGFGFLTLRTYLSLMSGNTTQIGCHAGQGHFSPDVSAAVAIVSFVAGVILGNVHKQAGGGRGRRWAVGGIGVLLAGVFFGTRLGWLSNPLKIALISLAMGAMNTTLSKIGNEQVSLTYVTGALNNLGKHLALAMLRVPLKDSEGRWDTHLRRAGRLALIWAGFLAGAVLVGALLPRLGGWTLLVPSLVLMFFALVAGTTLSEEA
jgi:uncharacterized membrane protein YoaK (UPF0700 family)